MQAPVVYALGVVALLVGQRAAAADPFLDEVRAGSPWTSPCFDLVYDDIAMSDTRTITVAAAAAAASQYEVEFTLREVLYANGGCDPDARMVTNTFRLGVVRSALAAGDGAPRQVDAELLAASIAFDSELAAPLFQSICPDAAIDPATTSAIDIGVDGCGSFFPRLALCPRHYSTWTIDAAGRLLLADLWVPFKVHESCSVGRRATDLDAQPKYVAASTNASLRSTAAGDGRDVGVGVLLQDVTTTAAPAASARAATSSSAGAARGVAGPMLLASVVAALLSS